MSLFLVLLGKILPLYTSILLGYLCVRYLRVDKASIAAILFYIIGPVVILSAVMSVRIDPGVLFRQS